MKPETRTALTVAGVVAGVAVIGGGALAMAGKAKTDQDKEAQRATGGAVNPPQGTKVVVRDKGGNVTGAFYAGNAVPPSELGMSPVTSTPPAGAQATTPPAGAQATTPPQTIIQTGPLATGPVPEGFTQQPTQQPGTGLIIPPPPSGQTPAPVQGPSQNVPLPPTGNGGDWQDLLGIFAEPILDIAEAGGGAVTQAIQQSGQPSAPSGTQQPQYYDDGYIDAYGDWWPYIDAPSIDEEYGYEDPYYDPYGYYDDYGGVDEFYDTYGGDYDPGYDEEYYPAVEPYESDEYWYDELVG